MSQQPTIADAKALAMKYRQRGVIILSFTSAQYASASYGMSRKDCDGMRHVSNQIADMIAAGDIVLPRGFGTDRIDPVEVAPNPLVPMCERIAAEGDKMEKEIERLRAALATVKADLLARADRQDAFSEPTYTQLTDADRAMYRHAANMLRLAAEAMKETFNAQS